MWEQQTASRALVKKKALEGARTTLSPLKMLRLRPRLSIRTITIFTIKRSVLYKHINGALICRSTDGTHHLYIHNFYGLHNHVDVLVLVR